MLPDSLECYLVPLTEENKDRMVPQGYTLEIYKLPNGTKAGVLFEEKTSLKGILAKIVSWANSFLPIPESIYKLEPLQTEVAQERLNSCLPTPAKTKAGVISALLQFATKILS